MACFFHHLDEFVEADAMDTIGEAGIYICVEGTCGGVSVTFDTGDLYETADGVAGHAEVMFETHFGSILDLSGATSEELACGSGRHGASDTDLTLTTDISTRYTGIMLDDIADETGSGESMKHLLLREIAALPEMIEHTGHNPTRSASRSGNDDPT